MNGAAGRTGDEPPTLPLALPAAVTAHAEVPPPAAAPPGPLAAGDPRLRWWARRGGIAAGSGGAVAALAGWQAGIGTALLAAAADTLFRARTTAVIPASVLVSSAQRRTRWRLRQLGPAGYLSLHGRAIPGTGSVIDHLVIGPAGVFAVDSQRWDRRLPVRVTRGGELFHGPFDQRARLEHAAWEAHRASLLIGEAAGEPVPVRPAMAIYGPAVPWVVASISGVDVFCGRRVRRYLRRQAGTRRRWLLTGPEVEFLCEAAAQALPPARRAGAAARG